MYWRFITKRISEKMYSTGFPVPPPECLLFPTLYLTWAVPPLLRLGPGQSHLQLRSAHPLLRDAPQLIRLTSLEIINFWRGARKILFPSQGSQICYHGRPWFKEMLSSPVLNFAFPLALAIFVEIGGLRPLIGLVSPGTERHRAVH
jgi:hypothetical protein